MSPNQLNAAVATGPWAGGLEVPSLGEDGSSEVVAADVMASMVSLRAEVPEALLMSMRGFIDAHPNWDQYRLFQAALAGFLVQNGVQSREVTRCYLANMFRR
ncbi:DUF2811 domain-containing protein [Cyanobium sp. ATX 6F1]|uniref:DUF2811 domain-containing protein n=2 Tax=unclassified Cyanobium TaxID=2627006 RepID=UPI0039656D1C